MIWCPVKMIMIQGAAHYPTGSKRVCLIIICMFLYFEKTQHIDNKLLREKKLTISLFTITSRIMPRKAKLDN